MEVVEGIGGLGVGDGVAVGAGVELLGDAVELDALGEEAVLGVAAEGVPSGGDVVAQVVEGGGDGGLVDDVAVDPAAAGGAEGEDVGAVWAEVAGELAGVEDAFPGAGGARGEGAGQGEQGEEGAFAEEGAAIGVHGGISF